ncbi:MAG: NRDE family protein [Deltaproteobacteria bacterium]|nr:NRDE family protein [Deltaproteobacteria bacterium]
MCTVVLIHRVFRDRPLSLVANRDELLDRPAEAPSVSAGSALKVLAPRDLRAGGTWLGVNSASVVVAITNRFGLRDDRRASRGDLVRRALEKPAASEAVEELARVDARAFNGFHLLMADPSSAWLIVGDGERLEVSALAEGVHVVTERSLGAGDNRRELRVGAELRERVARGAGLEELLAPLARHIALDGTEVEATEQTDPVASTCVHWPLLSYGTRSSTGIELGARPRILHAEGAPCRTSYRALDAELTELGLNS